jgi:galactan 5-O-arabinofuranosyltransferase
MRWAIAPGFALVFLAVAPIVAPSASQTDPTSSVVVQLCLIVTVTAIVVMLATPTTPDAFRPWCVAILCGAYLAVGATIALSGSAFPILGTGVDQGFRVAQVEHFIHTLALTDYAYRGLPAFYPPLYFWLLGRIGALTQAPAYQVVKLGALLVAFAVPLVTAWLWLKITPRRAFVIAVVLATVIVPNFYEPHEWLALVIFVPWWLSFVLHVGRAEPLSRRDLVIGVLIGAVLVAFYYYWFLVGIVQLVALLALRRTARRRSFAVPPAWPRQSAIVLVGAACVSAFYWLPLLVSIVTTPGSRELQNRFYGAGSVPVPTPFLEFTLRGAVVCFGLLYLLVTARRSALSFPLGTLVAAAYIWFAIGYFAVLLDTPVLTDKLSGLITFALTAGAAIGAVDVAGAIISRWPKTLQTQRRDIRLALVVGAVVLMGVFGQGAILNIPWVKEQQAAAVPTKLLDDVERGTRGRYGNGVMVTDLEEIPEYLPVHLFNTWKAHYAHPASLFDQRARFLHRVSTEPDPKVAAAALTRNRYDRVNWLVLRRVEGGFTYAYLADAFPNGTMLKTLTFPAATLEGFDRYDGVTVSVFHPRTHELSAAQRAERTRHFRGDL